MSRVQRISTLHAAPTHVNIARRGPMSGRSEKVDPKSPTATTEKLRLLGQYIGH